MNALRHVLHLLALGVLLLGPILILVFSGPKHSNLSVFLRYVAGSVAICSAAYWLLFFASDFILDQQFQTVVPNGEWTDSEELVWTDSERQVVAAYFADGARNVLALFAPIILLANSALVWTLIRGLRGITSRRAA